MTRRIKRAGLRDVVLIGGSQGGFEAVIALLDRMPMDLEAAVAITLHRSPTLPSILASVLAHRLKREVVDPFHGQPFQHRRVYVAPADHHIILRDGAIWLDRGPREHHTRPAVDVMFRTGAEEYGDRVIGVLLTGNLSDGVAGLIDIKRRGGISLVQDPAEAVAPSMPSNAILYDDVDGVFKLESGGLVVRKLVGGSTVDQVIADGAARHPPARLPGPRLR